MYKLFTKAIWKALSILRKIIPYNHKYKPTAVYLTSKEYFNDNQNKGAKYVEIYPKYITKLEIEEALYKHLSGWSIYDKWDTQENHTLFTVTDYIVVAIPNGRLYTNNNDMIAI